jgi:YD repeat-containing protein
MTNPDGGVTQYAYDARNRMVSLINPFTETTAWTCDAGGRVTRLGYGNGAYTLYEYDNAGQVLSIQHCKSDGTPI